VLASMSISRETITMLNASSFANRALKSNLLRSADARPEMVRAESLGHKAKHNGKLARAI
jgi:hypothetical protein